MSVDIDLFTDADYGSVDFDAIDSFLRSNYPYVDTNNYDVIGMGKCGIISLLFKLNNFENTLLVFD